jgi:gliding motility-associated-like protein
VRYFFLIIILFSPLLAEAQLSAPGMSAVRFTSYPTAPTVKDPIFIYCNDSGSQTGTLVASSPGGTAPFNFTWYQWSDVTKSFSILIKTVTGVSSSTTANLSEGGYRVVISGGFDTSLVAWVFLDKPHSLAKLQNRTCDYVALNGEAAIDTFFYKNPSNGLPIKLPDRYTFLWSSEPSSTIPFPDLEIDPQTFDPPLVDVTYILEVSDSFGCISSSSFPYESIHVKADFTIQPVEGGAPLEVTLTDQSVRAITYKWEFGENKDSISDRSDPPPHIYYIPGEYRIKLTVESDMHCIDSLKSEIITVNPSLLEIPNVFTPDGDGLNDYFVVSSQSLRYLNVEIYSRSGQRVYNFYAKGKMLTDWKGWDGSINGTSAKASPGVYMYVITARGWDDIDYDTKKYRGIVYLYR